MKRLKRCRYNTLHTSWLEWKQSLRMFSSTRRCLDPAPGPMRKDGYKTSQKSFWKWFMLNIRTFSEDLHLFWSFSVFLCFLKVVFASTYINIHTGWPKSKFPFSKTHNSESIHIWPQVGKAKIGLRGGSFFSALADFLPMQNELT